MNRWKGKVAVVTGASSGIGLALSKSLIQEGMIVVGLARRKELMESRMKNVDGSCRFHPVKCDVAQEENVTDSFKWIKDTFGSTNILINNAGVAFLGKVENTPSSQLQHVLNVNVLGLSYCTKEAIKLMKESQEESHIVNMCSILGHTVVPAKNGVLNIYSASKFAVRALSKTLRQELLDTKIRVSNISPGMVKAEIMEGYWDAPIEKHHLRIR
ncbi:hypothetical protein TSAR_009424 [Trichomalopsis sarcophagae]|uniref:Dehydrogenase/reductase SDR family member 11 n=1 Tax=Trichomalopsis sarcophagae TaxID=543379 RepID=A0A232FKJ2_9HYME|nr:hypothetical protein TSAR_009424 [Trichomalopsis sarcophagae]